MPNVYVIRDPARQVFHFLRYTPLTQRWDPDLAIADDIRNARLRFYHIVNPPPHYAAYQYATVDDNATLTLMIESRDISVLNEFRDIRMAGEGLRYQYAVNSSDPPAEDQRFRERRTLTLDGIEPPEDAEEELTPLQRVAQLLLAAGDPARPSPLAIPRTPLWDDWHTPLPRARRTDTALLRALLRREGDDAQAAAGAGGGGGAGALMAGAGAPLSFWERLAESQAAPAAAPAVDAPRRNIADAMIRDAISQKAQCPISMEPITQETATCVAPCYHVFCRESITRWLERETTCPTCREPCRM
jgi:hypothetical protein